MGWKDKYKHGAVPESVKQKYLAEMLDYYKNTNMQHMLLPEEYEETIELPFLSPTSPGFDYYGEYIPGPSPETTKTGTRYVTAPMDRPEGMPEHLSYGDVGPDYITMMNIMKAQKDPNFNIGFMSDEYMEDRPGAGAYFAPWDQTMAFHPDQLDWDDPRVQQAFSKPEYPLSAAGIEGISPRNRERNLALLEGTSLGFGPENTRRSDYWNRQVAAHELGHYGSMWGGNIGGNKFDFPNWTKDINMTMFDPNNPGIYAVKDKSIRDVQGHNMAYWLGRGHEEDPSPSRDMYLTKQGAQNYGAWVQNAKNYINDFNNPPRREPFIDRQQGSSYTPGPVRAERPTIRDVTGPDPLPSRKGPSRAQQRLNIPSGEGPPGYNYNTGGLASLML